MKTKLFVVSLILGLLILFGCEEETTKPDTTPPTVQITSPANNSTISGTVDIDINASDNKGVAKVEVYIDGTLAGETTSPPWGFIWDTTLEYDDDYTLQAKAYDTSNNLGTSDIVNVTIQNSAPELYVSTSTMDFGTTQTVDYFYIYNDGEGVLNWEITDNQNWITVSPTSGSDDGDRSTITVTVDRGSLSVGSYQGTISITSNGGSATVSVQMEVEEGEPFVLTFNNPLFTDIEITVTGYGTQTAEPGGSAVFNYSSNPGSITYHAETSGQTTSGSQVGLLLEWDYTHNVSGQSSYTLNLNVNSDYFFIYVENNSDHDFSPFYVNYGSYYETMDDIIIYNTGTNYRIGYYRAFTNTEVRAYWQDMPTWYYYWIQGTHFYLPFTDNQYVMLTASSSRNNIAEDDQIHIVSDKKTGKVIPGVIPQQNFGNDGICVYGEAKE